MGRKSSLGGPCTSCPGVSGSAFRGAWSTHSTFACSQLGCLLLELAPRIIACVLANSTLPTQALGSARKIKCLCPFHSLLVVNSVFFQSIHGGGESILPEARPPSPGSRRLQRKELEQAGKGVLGSLEQISFPLTSELAGGMARIVLRSACS